MFPTFSKIWMINVSLAVLIVFFGLMTYNVWSKGDNATPEIQTGISPEKPLPVKGIVERTMAPESTYGIVVDKNLFSASRTESVPEKDKTGPPQISEKRIFLYGVVLAGDLKQALISNPDTKPEPGKTKSKDKWVRVGDTLGNFTVADIRQDRIILAEGANQHEILLFDKNKPVRKTTVAQSSAAPTVITTGSPVPAPPAATAAPAMPAATAAAQKPGTEPLAPRIADGKSAPEGEYKIVNTPFGPIKRRIQ